MNQKKKSESRCYMADLYPEIADIEKAVFTNAARGEDRRVEHLAYQDPDQHCLRLYEDELRCFFGGDVTQAELTEEYFDYGNGAEPQYIIRYFLPGASEPIALTSDYIGPSATSAYHAGLEDSFVWDAIVKCRTLGGHVLWPRVKGGINPGKAGSGNRYSGISDRMDIALYEIKNYLDGNHCAEKYNTALWGAFEKEPTRAWLKSFETTDRQAFMALCDFFYLKGSFVDENYEVIWLAPKTLGKAATEDVKSFFRENIAAIERRNKILLSA